VTARRQQWSLRGFGRCTVLLFAFAGLETRAENFQPNAAASYEQRIGQAVPLDTVFVDAEGTRRPLATFFHDQPVVLFFGYARCPQLCSLVLDGAVEALRGLQATVGKDFQVVSISIDPAETATDNQTRQRGAIRRYGRTGTEAGWHFLTGDAAAIKTVAKAVGFRFTYDPRSHQYAHPSGFVIVTPRGMISRYFLGLDFPAAEISPALARAAKGKTGEPVFNLLLLCFRGDGIGGRYGAVIWRSLSAAVALTVLALAGGVGWMLRQEHRRSRLATWVEEGR
jgi:protein SCO1/2